LLPERIKFQIISNKIKQMKTPEFHDICSLLDFTPNDIENEKQELAKYLETLKNKIEKIPLQKPKKTHSAITQKEIDSLKLRPTLFSQSLENEYNRVFPLYIELIKKKYNLKQHSKISAENNKIISNLDTVMLVDIRKLNNARKEMQLKIREGLSPEISQIYQSKIERLESYFFIYRDRVYAPIKEKHKTLRNNANIKLEQSLFTVIDEINEKMEKIKHKINLDVKEFYFDDGFELHIRIKNKPPYKYPFEHLQFKDLALSQKKSIIQILKTKWK